MFAVKQTLHFNKWLSGLKDSRAKQKIALRIRRLGFGHFGDVKPVGDGVSELRIHEGKGYRAYFVQRNGKVIILLCGGNKKTQSRDITAAKALAKEV